MQADKPHRCSCVRSKKKAWGSDKPYLPILSGILIALVPKCPYCILAYSSAITMCSGAKLYSHTFGWTSYLLLALATLTLAFVMVNYRGRRTLVAASLVIGGSFLILLSQFYTYEMSHYNWGALLILFGVWVNGSFLYLFRKMKKLWLSLPFTDKSSRDIFPKS